MIPCLSEKICSLFIIHGIIEQEDKEAYSYSFEILLSTLLNFLAACIVSIVTRTVIETAFYLLAFIPLRQLAGGYHAKNHQRCFWIFMCVYAVFLLIIKLLPLSYIFITIMVCSAASGGLVFQLSPIDDPNKPMSEQERIIFKRKSRIAVIGYIILTLLMFMLNETWALSISLGMISVALSLLASAIKRKINCKKHSFGIK